MIKETIARLVAGENISRDDAYRTMLEIMNGEATESQIAGFLVALRMKGETVDEIVGSALRRAVRDGRLPAGTALPASRSLAACRNGCYHGLA